jgi:imidazolonepropionase-like amidohydrolase
MAGDAVELTILKKASEDGTVLSPRIYFSALMRGTIDERMKGISHGLPIGEAPWALVVTGQTDIVKAVAGAKSTGATGIKLYSDLSLELIIKITNEAHKQGLKVWSHSAIYPVKPSDAVNAGVDVLSHSNLIVSEGMENVPSRYDSSYEYLDYNSVSIGSSAISNLLELMLINGTVLDPSMLVTSKLENTEKGKIFQDPKKMAEWSYMVTMRAHIRKIPIVAGTDIQESPRTQDYPNIHKEMELLVEKAGFTPLEAITSATRNGAQVLGVLDSYGTISIGKVADLVILKDDPSMDIKNTTKIYAVIKGGVIHEWRKTILPD